MEFPTLLHVCQQTQTHLMSIIYRSYLSLWLCKYSNIIPWRGEMGIWFVDKIYRCVYGKFWMHQRFYMWITCILNSVMCHLILWKELKHGPWRTIQHFNIEYVLLFYLKSGNHIFFNLFGKDHSELPLWKAFNHFESNSVNSVALQLFKLLDFLRYDIFLFYFVSQMIGMHI